MEDKSFRSLLVLFGLFTVQFFFGMALNLLFPLKVTISRTFYASNSGNLLFVSHFVIGVGIVAVAALNLALVSRKSNIYKALSLAGLISVLSAFVNGLNFATSNFSIEPISYAMAASFMAAFILYLALALLIYRDISAKTLA